MKRLKSRRLERSEEESFKSPLLARLLVGDVDVKGHIEIVPPGATHRVICIDIQTKDRT